jgi:hypothetical protein
MKDTDYNFSEFYCWVTTQPRSNEMIIEISANTSRM